MIFTETKLAGAYLIQPEIKTDERGFFARVWCQNEFQEKGLDSNLVQCNISYNKIKGTVRGMHYQIAPYQEVKLVQCTQGAIYDIIIDIRPDSPTFKQWVGVELTASNRYILYIPKDFAHGFQTLTDNTEVFYQMSQFYQPEAARGIRWDDPSFDMNWLVPITLISEKDKHYPEFSICN